MIPRFQTERMSAIWSDEHKLETWFEVEIAWLKHYLNYYDQSDEALILRLNEKKRTINWTEFKQKMDEIEKNTRHDVVAFLLTLESYLGEDAKKIHIGLTSSDIVDTSFALLLKESSEEILASLHELITSLLSKAKEYKGCLLLGRTHGQAAEPLTFSIKLLGHISEFIRAHKRINHAREEILVGKFSGAVGVYSLVDPLVEKNALRELGLDYEDVATQVVCRDRHSAYFSSLFILSSTLERLANEIRLLNHGEIKEVSEGFFQGQKGSSAMPHKKNPILCENVCGLMRTARSFFSVSLENQVLWHERDISHSSAERIMAPDVSHLLHLSLKRMKNVVDNLNVHKDRMVQNIENKANVFYTQKVLLALLNKGLMRNQAYDLVQKSSLTGNDFKNSLIENGVLEHISDQELNSLFVHYEPNEDLFFQRVDDMLSHIIQV